MKPIKLGKLVTAAVDLSRSFGGAYRGTVQIGSHISQACLIGFTAPQAMQTGRVLAILNRPHARQDIWVVTPRNAVLYEWQIRRALEGIEGTQDATYRCFYEKSCGAVLFTGDGPYRRFLLLQNRSGHNGFPKGHVEADETEIETALREIWEETGIRATLIPGFRHSYTYTPNHYSQKEGVYFLGRFENQTLRTQVGEIFGAWLLPYEEALAALVHEQDRVLLRLAAEFAEAQS